ncbi:hypothetical protein DSECCO2_213310 [anaerobic digester metagenome]
MGEKSDHDLLIEIHTAVYYIAEKVDDHEQRIRPLEAQRNRWLGRDGVIVAGISAGVTLLVAFFTWILGGGWK